MLALGWGIALPGKVRAGAADAAGVPAASVTQAAAQLLPAVALHRLVIVGEVHGTAETPALVASLVRHVVASRPVRLGVEMPSEMEGALRAYLRSVGSGKDKAALLGQPFWSSQDGRSSEAMFELIEAVRALRAQGRDTDVFTMEPVYPGEADAANAGGYLKIKEAGMAAAIRREMDKAVQRQSVIALMGNFHARDSRIALFKGSPGDSVTERLGALLPYVVFPLAVHSESWNCTAEGCGVHVSSSGEAPGGHLPRLVPRLESGDGAAVVELWLARFTASSPAGKHSP
jgi:hypothetical protein